MNKNFNSVSIIIPCYKEKKETIDNCLKTLTIKMQNFNYDYEIIIVNDGDQNFSYDNVNINDVIKDIKTNKHIKSEVMIVSYEENKGKGYAVKQGIDKAKYDVVVFMDCDLATDLRALDNMFEKLYEYDVVIGDRRNKSSKTERTKNRSIPSICLNKMIKVMFKLDFDDTQCGFKGFRKEVAKKITKSQVINDFAFDVEYLYKAKLNGFSIKTIPVIWEEKKQGESTVDVKKGIIFVKDLFKIKKYSSSVATSHS